MAASPDDTSADADADTTATAASTGDDDASPAATALALGRGYLDRLGTGLRDEVASTSAVQNIVDAYRYMEMPIRRYLITILIPAIVIGALSFGFAILLDLPSIVTIPLVIFGAFIPGVAVMYPKILHDRKAQEIRDNFHLFITHLTILSMTNINRVEVFRLLANEADYEALADEAGHLVALVDTWNQSLDDAARQRSKKAPGELLPGFFERLAYNVGSGQDLSAFLLDEQDVIFQQFETRYMSNLDQLDTLGDLYLSMMLSTTFGFVFAVIVPFLTGMDSTVLLATIGMITLVVQLAFVVIIHFRAPADPMWYYPSDISARRKWRIRVIGACGGFSALVLAALTALVWLEQPSLFGPIPTYIRIAIPTVPLLAPALYIHRVESQIKSRDSQFPAFIRSLGSIEGIKQTSTSQVLESLRHKDFGNLTSQVHNLYRRLRMRINSSKGWEHFSAETGSYLIHKFSDMYVTGRRMGGDPREIGALINENFTEVLKLREHRAQQTTNLLGKLYGMTAATSFSFFIGVEIIAILIGMMADVNMPTSIGAEILHVGAYNLMYVQAITVTTLLGNAALSSLTLRLSNRRHMAGATLHFVALTWVSMITAEVTGYIVNNFMSIG